MKNQIYPCIWFNMNARDAAEFYCTVFSGSAIGWSNDMVVTFESAGQQFMFLNGGPMFTANPSVSFYVICESEEELNASWEKLIDGGFAMMPLDKYEWSRRYGWVQDRFGVSWQLSLRTSENFQQKFTPALMFTGTQNGNARKAIELYSAIFDDSEVIGIMNYDEKDQDIAGNVKHAQFRLNKQVFMAMDSSFPHPFSFNEAISLVVECDSQEEIDHFWYQLTEGGEEGRCGWLKDRFGFSWQIIPSVLKKLMTDPVSTQKVVEAFLKMKKFEIDKLI